MLHSTEIPDPPATLLFARGRLAALAGNGDTARRCFVQAQGKLGDGDAALAARIAFELGCLYLSEGKIAAVEAVLLAAEGAVAATEIPADLAHLRALLADAQGERAEAIAFYRRAIRSSPSALTPMTHVLALRNLAETICHQSPHEAATLYDLAIDVLDSRKLDPGMLPALLNGSGYALVFTGQLSEARRQLARAEEQARRHGRRLIALFALFNTAIVDELDGDVAGALQRLEQVRRDSIESQFAELRGWCDVRQAWLQLLHLGPDAAARSTASGVFAPVHQEALGVIYCVAQIARGEALAAAAQLDRLVRASLAAGDDVNAFVLLLWQALAHHRMGLQRLARSTMSRACVIASTRSLRISPNWWSRDVVLLARRIAAAEHRHIADQLLEAGAALPEAGAPNVDVLPDGSIRIGAASLSEEVWRRRAGRRVLGRLLRTLADAHPNALSRDELADRLWPNSEGDRAIRNLYGATKDLRRVLRSVPGLYLHVRAGQYRLHAEGNVDLGASPAPTARLGVDSTDSKSAGS